MKTDKNLYLVFDGATRSGDGYRYEVRNPNGISVNIEDYSVALVGGHADDPDVYTMRTQTEESRLPLDESLTVVKLGDLLSRPSENEKRSIEAAGDDDFMLYVDIENEETVKEAFQQTVDIVLQKNGERVGTERNRRNALPPTL